jgi:hypothetical protein
MFEFIARRRRTVGIVDIISQVTPRRPGEQDGNSRCVCVVHDLREAIEPFREHRVVAVNENEHLAPSWRARGQL